MKKNILFIITLILIFTTIIGISVLITDRNKKPNDKIEIVATLFPQYDFAKKIGGDKVNVTLLLPAGAESHTYEPTPKDMVNINNSKLFIYTGKEMEPWAEELISGMKDNVRVLDLSTTVKLINVEEFEEKHGMEEEEHSHEDESNTNLEQKAMEKLNDYLPNERVYISTNNESHEDSHDEKHEHEEDYEEHQHNHSTEHDHEHTHSYDPHIWLNPQYAIKMVESIKDELCKIDPQNAEYYTKNANAYIKEIQELDSDFEKTVNSSNSKKIAFGGAFAYSYFVERYNLDFVSAYTACGENVEPSTAQMKKVIDYIKDNNIPVIFYKEYTTGNVAKTISESTGTKMLVFNTVHNLSKDEIANNASYVSIMKQNLKNLKTALKVD